MNTPIPGLDLFHKPGGTEISIVHLAPVFDKRGVDKGSGCWGEIEQVELERFRVEGFQLVRQSLRDFTSRRREEGNPNDKHGFDLWPIKKRRDFFKSHRHISISLRENGDLWLDPVFPTTVGISGIGRSQERQIVTPDRSSEEFFQTVMKIYGHKSTAQ